MYARGELSLPILLSTRLKSVGGSLYAFREECGWAYQLLLVLAMAGVTGVAAQVAIPLPFTPVPLTGQVFAVLLAGGLLGRRLGPGSQLAYLGLGLVGVPWFAPATGAAWFSTGGPAILLGATGGYLIGFVPAAALVGVLVDRGFAERGFATHLLTALAGVAVVYAFGAVQLALVLGLSPDQAFVLGAVPFFPGDVLKAVAAAGLLSGFLPVSTNGPTGVLAPRRSLDIRRDVPLLAALLLALWLLLPHLATSAGASPVVLAYYYTAAAAATGFIALGGLLRLLVRRAARVPVVAGAA